MINRECKGDGTFQRKWLISRVMTGVECFLRRVPRGDKLKLELHTPGWYRLSAACEGLQTKGSVA